MSLSSNLLDVHDLTVKFPIYSGVLSRIKNYFTAVNHVSFSLKEGETLGVVGESGSGKTTIARALVKLIKSTSGQIFFRGKEIIQMSEKQFRPLRKDIQYIFQDPFSCLNPKLIISRIITEALDIHFPHLNHEEKKNRIIDLLKQVNLPLDILQRYPYTCSGGQRQRICIARALAVQPKLLICDEPVSSLDVSIQAQIINLLQDMQQKYHLSLIFISHDLAVVEHMSQKIMVILHGNIIELGNSYEIIHQPKHPYTRELLDAVPKIY